MSGKLRMKGEMPEIIDDPVLRAVKRAAKRRRRERKLRREEELTPPRSFGSKAYEMELDPDQIRQHAAWEEHYKAEEEKEESDRGKWSDKLQDAQDEDSGVGYHEVLYGKYPSTGFSFGTSADAALGIEKQKVDQMTEDQYAEYIRAGMWYKENKAREEEKERQSILREKKEQELREEEARLRDHERRRIAKLEREASKRMTEQNLHARDNYNKKWTKLGKAGNGDELRFTDIPWPIYPPMPLPPLSWPDLSDVTLDAVSQFVLDDTDNSRKQALRAAVMSYHPDRFERLVARIIDPDTQTRVRELGLCVSQVLNDLLK